jgi:hypothetical protein
MNDNPTPPKKDAKASAPKAEDIEAAEMARLCREAVEVVGADAVLVVWTKQRRRKTHISQTSLGNGLTVVGLMRWVASKVEEMDDTEKDEEPDEEDED